MLQRFVHRLTGMFDKFSSALQYAPTSLLKPKLYGE